ncbi:MAG: UDP-N-acetylmuramoyl-L-alanyl-D-glutamate--2,6-diaminopimelate ligase [Gammaproteobacteria bacterium]
MMVAAMGQQGVTLRQLCAGIVAIPAEADREIGRLVLDSREVQRGDVFLALQGHRLDAVVFIDEAIASGAVAILWQASAEVAPLPISFRTATDGHTVPVIAVQALDREVGVLADRFYQHPSQHLHVVGITGTNGKTSCSHYLAQALSRQQACGLIGTLGTGLYGQLHDSAHTTPDALTCHRLLAELQQQGATDVAMEVSSHALVQHRVAGVRFAGAVFTNLTHEHLDYHGSMQAYGEAKQRLFDLPDLQYCIINIDDPFGRALVTHLQGRSLRILTYGLEADNAPDILATVVEPSATGMTLQLQTPFGAARLPLALLGRFNASNILAVLAVLLQRGLPLAEAVQRLSQTRPVPGRMQVVATAAEVKVVVDYAHTPDALEQALVALREHTRGRLFCVFGCGGERDTAKRPVMGRLASELADVTILTNDNPRHEDPIQILDDILIGVDSSKRHGLRVIAERRAAIATALHLAQAGDVVLIAGKGHEGYQIIGNQRLAFSDYDVAHELLEAQG